MKRGLSPIIATVLLIAMVVALGTITFLWFRGLTDEAITKFGGENVKLVCGDVDFDASYSNGALYISNIGNVPIFRFDIVVENYGSHQTKSISKFFDSWSESYKTGLNPGATFNGDYDFSGESIILVPVLLGEAESGKREYACEERYGKELKI